MKTMKLQVRKNLPSHIKPLFWSYNAGSLDLQKNQKIITLQIINYGTLAQLKWLIRAYGREQIRHFIENTPTTEFRSSALKLIASLLSVRKLSYAPRGSH